MRDTVLAKAIRIDEVCREMSLSTEVVLKEG